MSKRFIETTEKFVEMTRRTTNRSLMGFAQKIYGKCPNCENATIIKAELQYYNSPKNVRVQCLSCTFYENWSSEKIYGKAIGEAKQPCPNCGTQWLMAELKVEATKPLTEYAEATCEVCHKTSSLPLMWRKDNKAIKPFDPYFVYPLWLQTNCNNEILWAYNEDHLKYLKSYIEADLREDDGRLKWSMITRLPKWMTAAKNRKDVIKAITKLELEFEKINL